MRHAFLIVAHANWNQLKTLITLLDDSRSSIYVHVDAKSKDFDPDFSEGSVKRGTLHFVHRIPVAWGGGDSLIKSEIILLEEALKSNSDYYHLIPGFDLPLHDMDYIDDFFIKHKGKEFIHFSELGETMTPRTRQRISIYHPFQNMSGRRCKWTERILNRVEPALGINRLRRFPSSVLGKGA